MLRKRLHLRIAVSTYLFKKVKAQNDHKGESFVSRIKDDIFVKLYKPVKNHKLSSNKTIVETYCILYSLSLKDELVNVKTQ